MLIGSTACLGDVNMFLIFSSIGVAVGVGVCVVAGEIEGLVDVRGVFEGALTLVPMANIIPASISRASIVGTMFVMLIFSAPVSACQIRLLCFQIVSNS